MFTIELNNNWSECSCLSSVQTNHDSRDHRVYKEIEGALRYKLRENRSLPIMAKFSYPDFKSCGPLAAFKYSEQHCLKGIQQYIFLLFHLEELLKLYVILFYRFCVTLLFLEIFEQKKSQISWLSAILDFGGYACDIISRVTQEFYP